MNMNFAEWLQRCQITIKEHGTCLALGDDIRPFPNLGKAYRAHADALGCSMKFLSEQEKRQAVLSAVLREAKLKGEAL